MQIHKSQLAEVVPIWFDMALRMQNDPAAKDAFGWILEVHSSILRVSAPISALKALPLTIGRIIPS